MGYESCLHDIISSIIMHTCRRTSVIFHDSINYRNVQNATGNAEPSTNIIILNEKCFSSFMNRNPEHAYKQHTKKYKQHGFSESNTTEWIKNFATPMEVPTSEQSHTHTHRKSIQLWCVFIPQHINWICTDSRIRAYIVADSVRMRKVCGPPLEQRVVREEKKREHNWIPKRCACVCKRSSKLWGE